jgi:hypothetical protein
MLRKTTHRIPAKDRASFVFYERENREPQLDISAFMNSACHMAERARRDAWVELFGRTKLTTLIPHLGSAGRSVHLLFRLNSSVAHSVAQLHPKSII